MSDVAYNDFTAQVANFSLPQLESLQELCTKLIAKMKLSKKDSLQDIAILERRAKDMDMKIHCTEHELIEA